MNVIIDQYGKRLDHLFAQATFIWETPSSSSVWTIPHKLGKYPSVTCVESTGRHVYGDVQYLDADTIQITFMAALTGKAYLN